MLALKKNFVFLGIVQMGGWGWGVTQGKIDYFYVYDTKLKLCAKHVLTVGE